MDRGVLVYKSASLPGHASVRVSDLWVAVEGEVHEPSQV